MTRGTDLNMCPPTGGLRNYHKGYEDGLNRGKAELAEVLDKISAEIDRINPTDYGGLGDYEVHSAVDGVKWEILGLVEKYKKEGAT